MDQLKKQLAVVFQHGFWICSAIVLLGSLAVWYLTTSKLTDEHTSRTNKLNSDHQAVITVRSTVNEQPNDLSHAEMDKLIDRRKNEVLVSWKRLYERQQSLLTWPVAELTQEMVDEYKDRIPIETHFDYPTPPNEEVESYLRSGYQRYIKNALPGIAAIAKAEWHAEFSSSAATAGGPMNMNMNMLLNGLQKQISITGNEEGPLVKWPANSQNTLLDDLFPWRRNGTPPSSLEVYYSQENLWILKQLLQIVAKVNGDARQPYQAKIHVINRIAIGKSVDFSAGNISKPGEGLSSGMSMGMADMMRMDTSAMSEMASMSTGVAVESPDPADNRYVNTKNEPITGAVLRDTLRSNQPADAEIAVAKRVPVMLSLQIDQRSIQQLVAECGSAPLMVEVSQLRVLPKSGATSLSGGGGMMEMEMMEDNMGNDMMNIDMTGNRGPSTKKKAEEFPMDMMVEVYGLIYMYNPPDPVKLGIVVESVTEEAGDASTASTTNTSPPADTSTTAPADGSNNNTTPADPATQPPANDGSSPPPAGTQPEPPVNSNNPAPPVAQSNPANSPPAGIVTGP
ncbi:MAG: hypothetical protein MI861_17560 [Pirellulales bacterium]|nr:hypothetical protein [Pirellulales bacterium]